MRVLYVITRADLGGAQVHVLDLLSGFKKVLDPVVAVGEDGFFAESVRRLGIHCHIIPSLVHPIQPLQDLRALRDLVRLIRAVNPDVIHAHTSKAGVIGRLAAWWSRTPSVFTAHTWCFAEGTSWKWRLVGIPSEKLASKIGQAIINVSDANRKLAIRHKIGEPGRLFRIWNGIADIPERADSGALVTPTIVMVARFAPQKDQALLLRAIAGISSPLRVLFIGDGPTEDAMQALAGELGVGEKVEFLGSRTDVARILTDSHIFALPSKWEGFPLSILEAMRAGLPVVVSDVGGVSEAVIDGCTGFLVDPGDLDVYRMRLQTLVERPELRAQMGEAGRRRYEENFTAKDMLKQTMAVYCMAISGNRATPLVASGNSLSEYSS